LFKKKEFYNNEQLEGKRGIAINKYFCGDQHCSLYAGLTPKSHRKLDPLLSSLANCTFNSLLAISGLLKGYATI
jgi:hypothetical protein